MRQRHVGRQYFVHSGKSGELSNDSLATERRELEAPHRNPLNPSRVNTNYGSSCLALLSLDSFA